MKSQIFIKMMNQLECNVFAKNGVGDVQKLVKKRFVDDVKEKEKTFLKGASTFLLFSNLAWANIRP